MPGPNYFEHDPAAPPPRAPAFAPAAAAPVPTPASAVLLRLVGAFLCLVAALAIPACLREGIPLPWGVLSALFLLTLAAWSFGLARIILDLRRLLTADR